MASYAIRRLLQAVLILLGVSFITFLLLYVLPADPVRQIAPEIARHCISVARFKYPISRVTHTFFC